MSRLDEIRDIVAEQMAEHDVPGVALGLLFEGEEEHACFGITSIDNPLDVTPDTLFQIGSIGKTFTATAVMRLVERGELDLDEPVRTYLPTLALTDVDAAERVTTRHLLTHTAGWLGDYFDDSGRGDDALAVIVERMANLPQLSPLGEVWSYNNAAFYLAGRVLEVLTELTFEKAVKELVLDPLGLEQSFYFPEDVMTYRFAVGHELDEDEQTVVARPWALTRAAHPAGGVISTVRDLLRYARFWIDGGDLLRPESVEEMLTPQAEIGELADAVGLAWMIRTLDGQKIVSHGGGTKGQVSWLGIVRERGFAFCALTNHRYGGVVIDRVTEPLFEHVLGIREPELEALDVPPEKLEEVAGRYRSRMSDVEIVVVDGGLEARFEPKGGFPTADTPPSPPPPPARLAFYDDDTLFAPEGIWKGTKVPILRGPDGEIRWLRISGRVYAPAER